MRDMLGRFDMPEAELRETLRKLDQAGLARNTKGKWWAIPLEPEPEAGDPAPDSQSD